ncbi:dihydropteroate synthase [Parasutterella muris]|uniref:Dihydropteroate synthase n=1 Tax=Parasutterella muris TaxID=2565572 RepID=A0A6L6YJQ1_9BURK|nr:dihydropteroate synthase [Parasutterella muris]MVX57102.1 dihydropteroate synthase [Parasutterella muris]
MKRVWLCRGREIDLSSPVIMGIVNVTPDSFSDGGKYYDPQRAIEHGFRLLEDGASILDVGGESTRPGAPEVSTEEELERVIPVIEALADAGAAVSVDTSKAEVMRQAAEAGAIIINDVYALRQKGSLQTAAESGCGVCLMHMQGVPRTMQAAPSYQNLIEEVRLFLKERADAALAAGIAAKSIVLDPGFGFGKTVGQNFELLARTQDFLSLGYSLLYGMSRKSSLGAVTGKASASERVVSSVAAHLLAAERGASILRVHDAAEMREALLVYEAMKNYKELK